MHRFCQLTPAKNRWGPCSGYILEFDGPSIRAEEAKKRNSKKEKAHPS
jgi:hypothetical protein